MNLTNIFITTCSLIVISTVGIAWWRETREERKMPPKPGDDEPPMFI